MLLNVTIKNKVDLHLKWNHELSIGLMTYYVEWLKFTEWLKKHTENSQMLYFLFRRKKKDVKDERIQDDLNTWSIELRPLDVDSSCRKDSLIITYISVIFSIKVIVVLESLPSPRYSAEN